MRSVQPGGEIGRGLALLRRWHVRRLTKLQHCDDLFTVGSRVFFAPDYNQSGKTATWVAAGVTVPLPHDFKVYGGLGYQFFEDSSAFEQLAWTAGLSYSWKAVTIDVRYWGTDLSGDECAVRSGFSDGCDNRVVATLSFDTSWTAARDWVSGK